MKTGNLEYTRNYYTFNRSTIDKEHTFYYLKYRSNYINNIFSNEIKVSKYKGKRKSTAKKFDYLIYIRNNSNWNSCINSGLAFTKFSLVFEGNIPELITLKDKVLFNPKHFIIVQFSPDRETLIVDVFENFYPNRIELLKAVIDEHNYIYDTPFRKQKLSVA